MFPKFNPRVMQQEREHDVNFDKREAHLPMKTGEDNVRSGPRKKRGSKEIHKAENKKGARRIKGRGEGGVFRAMGPHKTIHKDSRRETRTTFSAREGWANKTRGQGRGGAPRGENK